MRVTAFWIFCASFAFGVFVRSLLALNLSVFVCIVALALVFLALAFVGSKRAYLFSCIACMACALGFLRMDAAVLPREPALDSVLGESVVLEGVIFKEPDERESNTRLSVRAEALVTGRGRTALHEAGVLIVAPLFTDVSYGDRLRAEGELRTPEAFAVSDGRQFDYPGYLATDGILYELSFARVEYLGEGARNPLVAFAIRAKQLFLSGLGASLPEPHAGLAGGITAGDKRGLGESLSHTFRVVGLTHIVVLSGYNIMIVVEGLTRVLARAPLVARSVLGGAVAVLFALMTGLASASVRAAAMASIALFGRASGRTYLASRALALTAVGMVAWNPYVLVFDPGFQLSIIATWGLIALSPIVSTRLLWVPAKFGARDIAAATLSTQAAVLPLLLYQNGQLSLVSLPANLLALVAVPWAMLFSAVSGLVGIVFGSAAAFFSLPAYGFLSYVIGVAEVFASLPYASVQVGVFGAWWLAPVYALLGFAALHARRQ